MRAVALLLLLAGAASATDVVWVGDFRKAREAALEEGRLLLVAFEGTG